MKLTINKQLRDALMVFFCIAATAAHAEVEWVDRIIAVADEEIITQSELLREGAQIQRELETRNTPIPARDVFIRQVMERVVLKKLQLQRAARAGIVIDDNTLNQSVERIASDNQMTLPQFRSALLQEGLDYDVFRNDIRDQITLGRLQEREIDRKVKVTDNEIDEFIKRQLGNDMKNSYQLSHILVGLPQAATPQQIAAAQEKASSLRQQTLDGADFSQLAVEFSDGQLAMKGGDLGWRDSAQVPTMFADALQTMQAGDVSEPIRSPSGFHLIKINEVEKTNKPNVSQTHARHILLLPRDDLTPQAAAAQLSAIRAQVVAGADFAELAKQFSVDPGSAVNGGDLGWTDPGTFVPEFEEILNTLQDGQISQPFQSQFGIHLLQVLERRVAPVSDQALKTQARTILVKQKRDEAELLWLRRLRDEAFVEYYFEEFGENEPS